MNIIKGLRNLGGEGDEMADKILKKTIIGAPVAIRKTKEKILTFAIGDGSFAAGPSHESSGQSQGAWVDYKGTKTGNLNASIINSGEILDKIYASMELGDFFVPVFGKEDYRKFLEALPRE